MISYSGDGTDPDDGSLPASAFTWNIDFLHDGHAHPGTPITGTRNGSFTIPTSGHDFSGNTRYRITLTVRDSDGLTSTRSVTVNPQKVNLSFDTVPSGRTLYLDGIAKTTPFVHDTLVGFNHTIEARDQTAGNTAYTFASWSDGGARQHTITVPASPATYTASFNSTPLATGLVGAWSFNEGSGATARDSSANANHGTLVGPATWDPAGKYGAALSLSGLGGNVTVPHASSLNLSSSYTLEAWVKPTALNSYQTVLIKEQTSGCGYWLQTAGNRLSSGFNNGGCREHLGPTTPTIPLNQWSHLAAVFNDAANTSVLYLNGTAIATTTRDRRADSQHPAAGLRPDGLRRRRLRALARPDRRGPHLQPGAERVRDPGRHEQRDLSPDAKRIARQLVRVVDRQLPPGRARCFARSCCARRPSTRPRSLAPGC